MEDLKTKIALQMTARGMETLNSDLITNEIESAIEFVNDKRNFTPTTDVLFETKYKNLIIKMVIYAISKYGAEGEKSHSENGINRSYGSDGEYPLALTNQIIPKVKVV